MSNHQQDPVYNSYYGNAPPTTTRVPLPSYPSQQINTQQHYHQPLQHAQQVQSQFQQSQIHQQQAYSSRSQSSQSNLQQQQYGGQGQGQLHQQQVQVDQQPQQEQQEQEQQEQQQESQERTPDEPSEERPAKKKRISRACDACHGRRQKCQGFRPCANCIKKGIDCTYNNPYYRGRARTPPPPPDDPSTRNFARSTDIRGKEIRERSWVKRACDICRDGRHPCSGTLPCDTCFTMRQECTYKKRNSRNRYEDLPNPALRGPYSKQWPAPVQGPVAVDDDGRESAGGDAEGQAMRDDIARYGGPGQDYMSLKMDHRYGNEDNPPLVFLHAAWKKIAEVQRDIELPVDQPWDRSETPQFSYVRERWYQQQDHFFKSWNGTFHFLHRHTVRRPCPCRHCTHDHGSWRPLQGRPKDVDEYIWSSKHGDALLNMAVSLTDAETGEPRLDSVQARLLQDMYLLSTCRYNKAWYTFGNTLQMITGLGLHRRLGRNRGLGRDIKERPDYAKIQCERRTFWTAYIIDKQLSMVLGRPSHFRDDFIDQELPDAVNDEDMGPTGPVRPHKGDCYMEALLSHAKLNRLIDKLLHQVYALREIPDQQRIDSALSIGKEVQKWSDELPYLLRNVKSTLLLPLFQRQMILIRIAHSHATMLAYRPFITVPYPQSGEQKEAADNAIRECVDSARIALNVVTGLGRTEDSAQFTTLWYPHQVAYCAAVILAILPHIRERQKLFGGPHYRGHGVMDGKLHRLLNRGINMLANSTSPFSPAHRWATILEELKKEKTANEDGTPADGHENGEDGENEEEEAENEAEEASGPSPNDQLLEDALRAHWMAEMTGEVHGQADGQEGEAATPGFTRRLWDNWSFTDWVDMDSAAFGPIADFTEDPVPAPVPVIAPVVAPDAAPAPSTTPTPVTAPAPAPAPVHAQVSAIFAPV
ncbi:fungal-specific transcription factor domain-containing protein [Sordaria sp. MPI-SDFR-AT-0083]|nr:fungal-specific transcription factor domain-containing protein [Sordaria sp. MPI-SDFR-AT-0083]